jgi:histone demethylase JARID1
MSGKKMPFQDAQALLDTGEKLKVNTEELRKLRAELRAARNWSDEVEMLSSENGTLHANDVKKLIADYESFLIDMPEEIEELKQAVVGYCICRKPSSAFMIACDHCEEWYHGHCIGISESKADRFEKYSCIRCSAKAVFETSAASAVNLIRKVRKSLWLVALNCFDTISVNPDNKSLNVPVDMPQGFKESSPS